MPPKLTPEIISAAIDGLEEKRRRLEDQIGELRAMLPGVRRSYSPADNTEAGSGKRKKFSAASRRKMAAAQKARWAKLKAESEPGQAAASTRAPKPKRKMSAKGRQAIAEATRKRWEAFRAAKAQAGSKKSSAAKKKAAAKKVAAPATTQAAE
jgi:hypothetical protein